MPHQVIMPTLGLTMEEGTITEWLKQEGEEVSKEEPLFVVETDKSAVEVGAPASGVLQKILVPVGKAVPVSAAIAVIAQPGEAAEAPTAGTAAPGSAGPGSTAVAAAPASTTGAGGTPALPGGAAAPLRTAPVAAGDRAPVSPRAKMIARELGVDLAQVNGSGPEGRIVERDVRAAASAPAVPGAAAETPAGAGRIVASPLARKLATEHGVELAQLTGTGPNGRITEKDVTAFVQSRAGAAVAPALGTAGVPPAPAPAAPPTTLPEVVAAIGGQVEPLNRVRRITAERMAQSTRSVARVTLLMEVDMTEAVRFRGQLAPELQRRYGARLAYDAMIARAAAIALSEHPHVNAQWQEGADGQPPGLRLLSEINVGIAVAGEQGLLVVVLRDADKKPLHQVNADLAGLVEKARQNRLGPDDLSGGTFTITNLGGYGVEAFTPIVNPPESAILGVGRIAQKPAVVDGQIVARDLMYLSLAFDHRVVDGAPAAEFLRRLKEILEAPYILLA